MKAALLSEFHSVKSVLAQLGVTFAIVAVFVGVALGSPATLVACLAAMAPFMVIFTLTAYDMQSGWERFRATLPVTRRDLVVSRYISVLASSVVMLFVGVALAFAASAILPMLPFIPAETVQNFMEQTDLLFLLGPGVIGMVFILAICSLVMPLIARFGINKAMRLAPILLVLFIPATMHFLPLVTGNPQMMAEFGAWLDANTALFVTLASAATLALYVISCAVAVVMYRTKEL